MKLDIGQSFCKDISNHLFSQGIKKFHISCFHFVPDIVVLDTYILCSEVKDKVEC